MPSKDSDSDDSSDYDIEFKKTKDQILELEYYLYGDIRKSNMLELNIFLKEIEKKFNNYKFENKNIIINCEFQPIKLYINSDGGDLHAALPIVDIIRSLRIEVHTYVEGIVASAASIISVVGTKRFMTKNSFLLIHELRTSNSGRYSFLKDEIENCDILMDKIKKIYLENSSMTENDLNKLLKREKILSAEECLEYNLIDKII